jgi:ribonuclease HI
MAEAREIHLNPRFSDELDEQQPEPREVHLNIPDDMPQDQSNSLLSQDSSLLTMPADSPRARPQVTIHTDGACKGNPGPGGWGVILSCKGHTRELSGFIASTTNNQAELAAILQALQALTKPCSIQLYTDSQYVIGVLGKGFKRKSNRELLAQIDEAASLHSISYHWVQGHAANRLNQRTDELANSALRQTHKEVH